jgi:hypothetical protein
VPSDLATIADPEFLLLAWSAGLALSVAFVALARIVGAGFSWLTASVAFAIALPGALADGAWWARSGILLVALGLLWARNRPFAGLLFGIGGLLLLVEASGLGGPVLTVTAALALGGVTGEMALGHWYLVDPRLPRWALRFLAIVAMAGIALDSFSVWLGVGFPPGGAQTAFWMLAITSVILSAAVLGALRYPAYSGVMAATGLSYLAVLTTLGAVFLGRALAIGLGPFAS